MRKFRSVLTLAGLVLVLLGSVSCSDKETTVPELKYFSDYFWDYENVLGYSVYHAGNEEDTTARFWLTSKGTSEVPLLKINDVEVSFRHTQWFDEGMFYANSSVLMDPSMPMNYEITKGTRVYTGVLRQPVLVTGTFPVFEESSDYQAAWACSGVTDPDYFLILADFIGNDQIGGYIRKQIGGNVRNFSVSNSTWQNASSIASYSFIVESIVYNINNDSKVMTIGSSSDSYAWGATKQGKEPQPAIDKLNSIIEHIHLTGSEQ